MKIFAHRGIAERGADENSIQAFCSAVEQGIDGIELDIRKTRDDEAVIVHDSDLRRIAGDNRKIESLSLQDLRRVTLRKGSSIPTLDDITASVPFPIVFDFEVKDARVLDLLITKLRTSRGLRSRSIISSFKKKVIERAWRDLEEVPRILLLKRWPVRTSRLITWMKDHQVIGVGLGSTSWNRRRVSLLHEHKLQAVAWEAFGVRSSRRRARRLANLGIDVAIVNQPRFYKRA